MRAAAPLHLLLRGFRDDRAGDQPSSRGPVRCGRSPASPSGFARTRTPSRGVRTVPAGPGYPPGRSRGVGACGPPYRAHRLSSGSHRGGSDGAGSRDQRVDVVGRVLGTIDTGQEPLQVTGSSTQDGIVQYRLEGTA